MSKIELKKEKFMPILKIMFLSLIKNGKIRVFKQNIKD
jgi:hypothetical protein